jgi:hypothetical protein
MQVLSNGSGTGAALPTNFLLDSGFALLNVTSFVTAYELSPLPTNKATRHLFPTVKKDDSSNRNLPDKDFPYRVSYK